ncbi:MAG: hypothetical protein WKF73_14020 [Nocardioidaceae bacterium]
MGIRAASVVVIAMGSAVLLGWTLDIESLKGVLQQGRAANPGGTAIGFCLRASLWMSYRLPVDEKSQSSSSQFWVRTGVLGGVNGDCLASRVMYGVSISV